jgi:hypothetical protein
VKWTFLDIEPLMKEPGDTRLRRQLAVADKLFLKVWLLTRWLQIVGGLGMLTLLALLVFGVWRSWGSSVSISVSSMVCALVGVGLSLAGLAAVSEVINYRKTVQDVVVGIGMATVGFLVARLHLHVFDRIFLAQGRLARLLGSTAPPANVSVLPLASGGRGSDKTDTRAGTGRA